MPIRALARRTLSAVVIAVERLQFLVDARIIDIDQVSDVYFSKMEKIVNNQNIFAHILKGSKGWRRFQKLWSALVEYRNKSGEVPPDQHDYAKAMF